MAELPLAPSARNRNGLLKRLDLALNVLPAAGEWSADDDFLNLLAEIVVAQRPMTAVSCGSGLPALVLARSLWLSGGGRLTALEHDAREIEDTRIRLTALGLEGIAEVLEAPLGDYDDKNGWYERHVLNDVPDQIDLLLIDGPPIFAGRTPREPAGAELFPRLSRRGIVILDDGKRAKEKKTLSRWEQAFPHFKQTKLKTERGAVLLSREGT